MYIPSEEPHHLTIHNLVCLSIFKHAIPFFSIWEGLGIYPNKIDVSYLPFESLSFLRGKEVMYTWRVERERTPFQNRFIFHLIVLH